MGRIFLIVIVGCFVWALWNVASGKLDGLFGKRKPKVENVVRRKEEAERVKKAVVGPVSKSWEQAEAFVSLQDRATLWTEDRVYQVGVDCGEGVVVSIVNLGAPGYIVTLKGGEQRRVKQCLPVCQPVSLAISAQSPLQGDNEKVGSGAAK